MEINLKELINKQEQEIIKKENENEYKYRLVFEYKELIEKRVKLEKYIDRYRNVEFDNPKLEKNFELLKQQLDAMLRYEEIISMRIRLELTTD